MGRMDDLYSSEQGSVLIVVMVVCIGLVSLTLVFGHSMLMAYRGSETDVAGRQANRAIDGAVQYAEYLMTVSGSETPGYLLPDPTTYQSGTVQVGDAMFWYIGDPATTGTAGTTDQPAFGLTDEASKLNINTATLAMLENLPNMTQNLAQAIVTWRTASGTSSTTTTTSTQGTNPSAKGGPFESIYELAQVCSVDGDDLSILYGNDVNMNHVLDTGEDQGQAQYNPGILEYVTVFSREPNKLSDGTRRVNVTTGGAALTTLLSGSLGDTRARQIARAVGSGPVRSVLEYYVRSGMTADEFAKVSPKLTMSSGNYSTGLINVNTASEVVLACVPGITQPLAQQLVSTRQSQTTPANNLAWVVPVLGREASIQAGPYLTAQSWQVTADVAAVGRNGRGYRRMLTVIDGSTGTPQIVYRHNMAGYGWALGPQALQNARQNAGQTKTHP